MGADYTVENTAKGQLLIKDLNLGNISVTNDAEAVVAEVFKAHGDGEYFYVDSDGCTSRLLHSKGVFSGFLLKGAETQFMEARMSAEGDIEVAVQETEEMVDELVHELQCLREKAFSDAEELKIVKKLHGFQEKVQHLLKAIERY